MTQSNARKTFINLPVRDLARSKAFFTKLGFEFNPKFTDDKAASMIISDAAFAMLLVEPFFQGFTKKRICDTETQTETLIALSCNSRAEVDSLLDKALAAGGLAAMPPVDHGFMYACSFYDLDGHHWELVWMDPSAVN